MNNFHVLNFPRISVVAIQDGTFDTVTVIDKVEGKSQTFSIDVAIDLLNKIKRQRSLPNDYTEKKI